MADDQTIARIDAYILANNGDLTVRCGSLDVENQVPADRRFTGELATGVADFTFDEATLDDALDRIDTLIIALQSGKPPR